MKELYKLCSELPFYNFVKIVTTDNYTWLNISREVTDDVTSEHVDTWNDIYQEYMSLTKNTKQLAVIGLLKEITMINLRLEQIGEIIAFLTNDYDKDLVKILKSYGFRYKYDPNSENYDKDLKMTLEAAKSMIIRKANSEMELEALRSEADSQGESTEQDYLALIIALSKFMGYRIDWKVITVAEYVELLNSFTKYAEKNGK